LRQYIPLNREINYLVAERARLNDVIITIKAPDGMPHGTGTSDPTASMAIKLATLGMKLTEKIKQLLALRDKIEEAINDLPPEERTLMRLRYIDGNTWEEIAVKMHYSYRWTTRLHGRILKKIA